MFLHNCHIAGKKTNSGIKYNSVTTVNLLAIPGRAELQ